MSGRSLKKRLDGLPFLTAVYVSAGLLALGVAALCLAAVARGAWSAGVLPAAAVSALALLFLLRAALAHTKKLKRLRTSVDATIGSFSERQPAERGRDEADRLAERLSFLADVLDGMYEEHRERSRALKIAELEVLQAQINPHFLYNTLDMIHWMALRAGEKNISYSIENLAGFYRFSLAHGEGRVEIEKELYHVKTYVNIQNIRYDDKIHLEIDVPPELMRKMIIRMVFQPLVENSIQHGIRERGSGEGTIRVFARQEGERIMVGVEDDGIGMSPERLASIRSGAFHKVGYGVDNINRRLLLYYGPECGLEYESTPGAGTTVRLRFPDSDRQRN